MYACAHALFPSGIHHHVLQTLPLTPKECTKNEENQPVTTLQGCGQKSHDLLIRKLVTHYRCEVLPQMKLETLMKTQNLEIGSMFWNPIK